MPRNYFEFETDWTLDCTPAEAEGLVHEVLADASVFERLWPAAFLRARVREAGSAAGLGQCVELHTRGFLPYTLRWQVECVEARPLQRYVQVASGDLVGTAVWTMTPTGSGMRVHLDWRVRVDKPVVRLLAHLLRPLIVKNHRWAMARGRRSIEHELQRRRALRLQVA